MLKDFMNQLWKNVCVPTLILIFASVFAIKFANWLIALLF